MGFKKKKGLPKGRVKKLESLTTHQHAKPTEAKAADRKKALADFAKSKKAKPAATEATE